MGACVGPGWRVLIQALTLLSWVQPVPGISSKEGDLGGGRLAGCSGRDRQTLGKSSGPRAQESAKGFSDDQESEIPVRAEESQGLHLSSRSRNLPHDGVRVELRANHVLFMSDQTLSCPPGAPTGTEEDLKLETPSSASWEKNILKTASEAVLSVVNGRTQAALDRGNHAHRSSQEPSVRIVSFRSSSGPSPHCQWMCAVGKANGAFCDLLQCTCPMAGLCNLKVEIPSCAMGLLHSAEDVAAELLPGTAITSTTVTMGPPSRVAASAQTSTWISHSLTLPSSSDGLPPGAHCTHSLSASQPGSRQPCPLTQCHPGTIPVQGPADQVDPVTHRLPETDTQSPQSLGFQIQMASEAALCLVMDFGDRSGVRMRIRNVSEEMAVTAYHKYGKEGVYVIRAVIYNEFYGTEVELGPYYVEIGHEAVSVFMNSSSVHEDELLVFAGSHRDQKSTVVMHRFPSFSSYNVSFTSQTQVGDSQAWPSITVWYQMQSVSVYTNGTVFSTDTDITFVAVTKETAPLEFVWYFGEDPPVRTTSRSIKKRLGIPQWYRVLVTASNGIGSVASEPHHIRVQRRIVANRLTSASSALVNASVTFECRINFGTDVAYLWNFGDGAVGLGNSSATHVYSREGEFTVEVLAFNNVSSASLRKQLFIVRQPCQPPPVKNMGPGKVQVWRSQPLKLGVTFEAEVLCDISQGLSYTWSFMNSVGLPVPLPPAISSHGKTITVPSYFLEPGNYTALAKVQVEGSAVHSNYCIEVEVRARAPVSLISEGTHLFISRTPSATIVLSGSSSYDPDEPGAALSDSYDQFLVTLMVSSNGRTSSEAQVFLSTRPDLAFRFVHISRVNFKDIFVNWNEELSLQAECEGCGEISNLSYSWDLFLVNATEKNSIEGTNINLPGSGPSASADGSRGDGDNLVGPFLPTVSARPALLVDWPKSVVSRAVFHGYTSSGITEKTVTIKPYSLSPGETYVLQASVGSKHSLLGKAQLYLTVNPAPQDVACQVQPHHGLEAHTVFSVFCMSGRPDFRYEFSYQIGNTSKHTLYHGRDNQYYFALPAGEPLDNYKVMVSTEITDGEGSQVQPCSVAVTVRPRFHGNHCPGEDVYNSSLKNLSTLQLMGSYTETRNYITMITRVLSRWAKEDRSPSCGQWSRIQDALISSVCRLAFTDQLSFTSAVLILKYTQTLLTQSQFSGRFVVDKERMLELILLVSGVLEVSDHEKTRKVDYLREEGIKVISDLLLGCLSSNSERQLHVSTGQMEIRTLLHHDLRSSVQSLGPVQVHLPGELAGQSPAGTGTQSPCYVSQLMLFKKNPYPGGRAPSQVGRVLALSLYSCSSRTPISGHRLRTPVTVEFGEEDGLDNRRNKTTFVLLRDKVNFHQFIGLSENPQESLQIRIEFSKPLTRAFPVMLLVRFSEKPTPSDFLVKQIYFWDEQIVHIYIPAVSLRDTNLGYLSLLDADYDRKPPNKYLAKSVNYAVHFQWIQCLFWDTREWKSESFSPQPGTSPEKVNCRHPENLLPGIFIVVFTILYVLLVTKSRRVDHHEKKKTGYIFLQENAPPDHQLYAVVVDTGFRAPARFTAKVYIVLCGENGLSEPKELYCAEKPLFERNSRHTFILSAPAPLGPLRKLRLWHDGRGHSPAWYVSHVMVKELRAGQGQSWLFPAECWLAVSRQDGRVERELACLTRGLGFRKLLYAKFTEYLEDFHVWTSVLSRPSCSTFLHTPRLTVAFTLLCSYSCLAALLTAVGQEQLTLDVGPSDVTLGSFWTGFLCTLLASPGALLLSLFFRLSQVPAAGLHGPVLLGGTLIARTPSLNNLLTSAGSQWASRSRAVLAPERSADRGSSDPTLAHWHGITRARNLRPVSLCLGGADGGSLPGDRFSPMQCVQWLRLLTLSVVCCVFVTQPLMIGLVALGFAGRRKDDKHFFTESLHEATKDLDSELEELSRTRTPLSSGCSVPDCASEIEKVLAARRQARRLRWARPPSTAQLRMTRERMRREMRTREALRDISMYILMLLLHLFIIYGKFSRDEYSLNRAIQNEFTRNTRSFLGGLRSVDDWWDWSLTTLLDGLYQESSSTAGMLGAQLPSPPSGHFEDSLPTPSPTVGSPESPSMIDPEIEGVAPSGPRGCREDCALSLGRTRPAARAALARLRASRWINCSTRAVSVHFTLYNPPTRLFSSVSLSAEMLPTGGLALSSLVESFHIFRSNSARYRLILPELSIVGVAFAYYAASGHLGTLAGEVTDQFHKGFFQGLADLSHMASWNQLRGFLMSLGQKRKSFPSKSLVRLKDVTAYMWGETFTLLGLERPKLEETEMVQNHNYYLDEFADLLDELLLKINGLSDSLQLSFLEQQSNDTVEARVEDSPLASVSAYQATGIKPY
ncbi:hypothetical protein HPG69_012172 [Diceros bicornis minor]|uniref:Polycystin-1-like protein 1 n=1 Tax=Diceros bicornis minor TaxID=77932 RepID=A0A7J7EM92_DICBM|nr:hypothetical protein HPG69_012172 [Diceros bicornis minor]